MLSVKRWIASVSGLKSSMAIPLMPIGLYHSDLTVKPRQKKKKREVHPLSPYVVT